MTRFADDRGLILVLGANGKTGSRVAQRLEAQGRRVRRGSRTAETPFDWTLPATWPAVVEGVSAAYVSYQPDLAVPGAVETVTAFLGVARDAGVKHVVLLSGRGEQEAEEAERALIASGLGWTILRASWFFQNFSESFFADDVRWGELVIPAGLAAEPFVDAEDIADIAAAALTGPGHIGALYEVTGRQALSFGQAMGIIGGALRRRIAVTEVPLQDYLGILADHGLPPEERWLIEYLFTNVLDGRNVMPCDGVRKALGRPAASLEDFARRSMAAGVWHAKAGADQDV